MIIFDYGHTLMTEPEWDVLRGTRALLRHAVRNPRGLEAEEVSAFAEKLHAQLCEPVYPLHRELHEWQLMRLLYGLLQIEFSVSVEEQERVFYTAAIRTVTMPHVEEMLAYLEGRGIRKGIVSNIMSSGGQLRERIARHLPLEQFEFVIASSDCGVSKPDPLIFRLALAKADLPPEEVWFCGDTPRCDAQGAHATGIFPVWYEDQTMECTWRGPCAPPDCPHLHIHDWRELIEILRDLPCTIPT